MILLAPDSGMAMGIGLAMLCMIALPALALGALGALATRRKPRGARALAVLAGLLAGPAIGVALVKYSFDLPWSFFFDRW